MSYKYILLYQDRYIFRMCSVQCGLENCIYNIFYSVLLGFRIVFIEQAHCASEFIPLACFRSLLALIDRSSRSMPIHIDPLALSFRIAPV